MARDLGKLIVLILFIAARPQLTCAQNECPAGTMAIQYSRDASDIQHQISCMNLATGALVLPNFSVSNLNNLLFAASYAAGSATGGIQEAISHLPAGGGVVLISPGTTAINQTINVNVVGVEIRGFGFGSHLQVNFSGDVFNVTSAAFKIEDVQIDQSYTSGTRGTNAIIVGAAQTGTVRNCRVTGAGTFSNGVFFRSTGSGANAGIWSFEQLQFPGGVTWTNAFLITNSDVVNTSASYFFRDVGGSALTFTDAAIVLDGDIDTARFDNVGFDSVSGTVWDIRNTVGGLAGYPRWVHIDDSYPESVSGTILNIQTGRDIQVTGGYFANATMAVAIGATAVGVKIDGALFAAIGQSAVTIANGAGQTRIINNQFDDTCDAANNTYDTISVAANTSSFVIEGNSWRNVSANKCRYGVNVAAGTSTSYRVQGNDSSTAVFGTAFFNDGGTGAFHFTDDDLGIGPYSGSASAPSYAFAAQRSVGWYRPLTSTWGFTVGALQILLGNNVQRDGSAELLGWSSNADPSVANSDVNLSRSGAGILQIGTGETANSGGTLKSSTINSVSQYQLNGVLAISATAPTISSGFGTSPSIVSNNGTLAFQINVGTGGAASSGVIGLPTAAHFWTVNCQDVTTGGNFVRETASTTTTATLTNYSTGNTTAAWTASDKLNCMAVAF